jgi:aconitate hydratase
MTFKELKSMGQTLTHKILSQHLIEGQMQAAQQIGIKIDQTLTQDATGTTSFLLYESMGGGMVKTDLSVSYVDHNMSQFGPENHNDHLYLQTVAAKSGVFHSRPGNGICHQLHLERFGKPGATLLGSDSHTPTCGGIGMIAIGAGGMDVAVAMAGGPFYVTCPKVIGVKLSGKLNPWVTAKDVILKMLSILTTKGNVDWVVEYFGPAIRNLTVPQRATITNMGAEMGVTTSVFPSDEQTRKFLVAQNREKDYQPLAADKGAKYDKVINIDLSELEPMIACPSSPGNIKTVKQVAGTKVNQVVIGSCTNSSFTDLMLVAKILKGQRTNPNVEFGVAPGSREVLNMLAKNGALADIITSGARILEVGCGPCIGQGYSPADGTVTVRTFNRNFADRTGTKGDKSYLVSPEVAVATALTGCITDPRDLPGLLGIEYPNIKMPKQFDVDDSMIDQPLPASQAAKVDVFRGPTIVVPEAPPALVENFNGRVILKCGEKITTDHIMPAGVYLKFRSNVPEYAKVVFNCFNEKGKPTFADKALELKKQGIGSVIVASESYGQGSSREHAALCPMYLGVRAVIAKSIERIHKANLINFAIVPIEFADPADYDKINQDDEIQIPDLAKAVKESDTIKILNKTTGKEIVAKLDISQRDREVLLDAGLMSYTRNRANV